MTPEQATQFSDHWADTKGEWSHRGSRLTWLLVPHKDVSDALVAAIDRIQLTYLVPVPAERLHVTLQPMGGFTTVPEDRLPYLIEAVSLKLAELEPFRGIFLDPVVGTGGIYCDLAPKERFTAVWGAVRAGMARVSEPAVGTSYWPHLALAYATGSGPIDSVDTSLILPTRGVSWVVDHVTLAELRRTPERYKWDVVVELPVGRHRLGTLGR